MSVPPTVTPEELTAQQVELIKRHFRHRPDIVEMIDIALQHCSPDEFVGQFMRLGGRIPGQQNEGALLPEGVYRSLDGRIVCTVPTCGFRNLTVPADHAHTTREPESAHPLSRNGETR